MGSRLRLLAALVCVPAVAVIFPAQVAGAKGRSSAPPTARQLLVQINGERTRRGLKPLRLSRPLTTAADRHTREMGKKGFFSHDSADGTSFWQRVRRFYPCTGYTSCSAGENILWSSAGIDAAGAVRLWMKSPGHRRNILTPGWREIGISARSFTSAPGTYRNLGVTVITTDFGTRVR